jgi:hypothetical protein
MAISKSKKTQNSLLKTKKKIKNMPTQRTKPDSEKHEKAH